MFLSYASQDAESAKKICDSLRAAGVEVWFDQNELVGGDAWDAKIRRQIKECALFVPIISANTNARREGYFRREWKLAVDRTHDMDEALPFLLPVVIDATTDANAFVPEKFREVQWTRLPAGETSPAFCARVGKLLNGGATTTPGTSSSSERGPSEVAPRPRLGRRVPAAAWFGAIVAAATLIGWIVLRPKSDAGAATRPPISEKSASQTEAQKLTAQMWAIYDRVDDTSAEEWALAEELGAQAVKLEPLNAEAWAAYSAVMVMPWVFGYDSAQARFDRAVKAAERAQGIARDSIHAQFALANCYRLAADTRGEAVRLARELARREPNNRRLLRLAGNTLRRTDNLDEAIQYFDRANALPGGDVIALFGKERGLMEAGRFAEAEAVHRQTLALSTGSAAQVRSLFYLIYVHDDLEAAAETIAKIPGSFLLRTEGVSYASVLGLWRRDYDKTIALLRRYSADKVFDTPKGVLIGELLALSGKTAAAEVEWRTTLQKVDATLVTTPNDANALYWKALLLARLGDKAAAERGIQVYQEISGEKDRPVEFLAAVGHPAEILTAIEDRANAWQTRRPRPLDAIYSLGHLRHDPSLDPLRTNPRFQAVLARFAENVLGLASAAGTPTAPGSGGAADKSSPAADSSIAVLAFANLSDDKANEYFSDGISEELLNVLAKIPGLKVCARTSAFSFKGKNVPIPEIARQLGVAYVLEGSVRKAGAQVRITAQLIKAADGFHVWSENFNRELKDIFAVQDEIAGVIARALQVRLGPGAPQTLTRGITQNPEAYEAFLKGRQAYNAGAAEYRNAVAHLQTALRLDPNFALAHGALAETYVAMGAAELELPEKIFPLARAAADRALALDDRSVGAYIALAEIAFHFEWDYDKSDELLKRALAIDPGYAGAHGRLGSHHNARGHYAEAMVETRRAEELDPLRTGGVAWNWLLMRRWSETVAAAREELTRQPGMVMSLIPLGLGQFFERKTEEALRTFEEMVAKNPDDLLALSMQGWLLGRVGQKAGARAVLERMNAIAATRHVSPLFFAIAASGSGDHELAFAQLERAFTIRDPHLPDIASGPLFDPIRSDPRFRAMLQRLKLDRYFPKEGATR